MPPDWNQADSLQPAAERAAAALGRGEVIGLPTETVYGLAGDATNPEAVRRIFALKGRPVDHPVIVHLADAAWLGDWAREVPADAERLARRFWPGPLTLILRRAARVSDALTGGQDTIGLRVPGHPVALAVLREFGRGLAAPSANRFGHVSPTTAAHVHAEFGASLPMILDGGPCTVGIESTIIDLSGGPPRVLRPGWIGAAALAEALEAPQAAGVAAQSPRVSGSLRSHYAPRTRAQLVPEGTLSARVDERAAAGERIAVLALGALPAGSSGIALPSEPEAYARALYSALRSLDALGAERILIEAPPARAEWIAIADRLRRATAAGTPEAPDAAR